MEEIESSEVARVRDALPGILAAHPRVAAILDRSCLLLHGSTTIGMERPASDWDLWVLTDDATHAAFAAANGTRFVEFAAARAGHFQVESLAAFRRRVARCDMELISELRYGVALSDPSALAADLLRDARRPMSDAVRRAWFRYHYVEMRSEHRACDGAAERPENPTAMLIGATRTIEHALRAAMVIDGEPYRYGKWLAPLAARTPTGARLVPVVNEAIELIGAGGLRDPAPESAHPLILTLKRLRQPLVEAARAAGADGPWLTEWWLHIDTSRQCVQHVSW